MLAKSQAAHVQGSTDKDRFDLQIRFANVQGSFYLARVKQRTTVFEIKQAIEKLKQFRIAMQSLRLPDYLIQILSENVNEVDNLN